MSGEPGTKSWRELGRRRQVALVFTVFVFALGFVALGLDAVGLFDLGAGPR